MLAKTLRFRTMAWSAAVVVVTAIVTLIGLREGVRLTIVHEFDQILTEDLYEIEMGLADAEVGVDDVRAAAAGGRWGRSVPAAAFIPAQPTLPRASRLHEQTAHGGQSETRQLLDELNRKARGHQQHGWFVQLLAPGGRPLWSSENSPRDLSLSAGLRDFEPATVGSYRVMQNRSTSEGFSPLTVRVGASTDFIARDMARIDRMVTLAAGVVLVVAPLGGFWLSGRVTRPLANLIGTTARLRPSRLEERLPVRGTGDELDQLARTFNRLLDRIAAYLSQKHDFLANSAHELRTPIAAIRSSAEVALGGRRSPQEYQELLAEVVEECASLEALVNQLLLLAETDADRLQIHGETIDLSDVVERSAEMFRGAAESRHLDLRVDVQPEVTVEGNGHHLRQVLNNLLDNAVKFTPEGGRIQVDLDIEEGDHAAVLRVRDTGRGIAAEDLPHVFERFYRGDKSGHRGTPARGTGLGLSICKAVAEAHGGRVFVESATNRGTTVTVVLPLAPLRAAVRSPAVAGPF